MAMTNIPAKIHSKIRYMYDPDATGIRNGKPYKGIVIAIMENCESDAAITLYKDDIFSFDMPFFEQYIPNKFTGVAYCSVEDEFNLNEGLRIARTRMLKKYNRAMRHVFDDALGYLARATNFVLAQRIKHM